MRGLALGVVAVCLAGCGCGGGSHEQPAQGVVREQQRVYLEEMAVDAAGGHSVSISAASELGSGTARFILTSRIAGAPLGCADVTFRGGGHELRLEHTERSEDAQGQGGPIEIVTGTIRVSDLAQLARTADLAVTWCGARLIIAARERDRLTSFAQIAAGD